MLVDPVKDAGGLTTWSVQAGGRRVERAAWMHEHPPEPLVALANLVTFSCDDSVWFEEEPLFAHARNPHKRVDVAPSTRHVSVESDGALLAASAGPLLSFETSLPVRYYLPPQDVRVDLLLSATASSCPYKGVAAWWSARVGDRVIEDVAWSYPRPIPENPRIAGLVCFRNERLDLAVDGQRVQRPVTPWS